MELRDYVRVLRTQKIVIAFFVVVGLAVAIVVTLLTTREYNATAKDLVSPAPPTSTSSPSAASVSQYITGRMKSYTELGDSASVLQPVINSVGLTDSTAQLAARVTVTNPTDTSVLVIVVKDYDAGRAAQTANAVATSLVDAIEKIDGNVTVQVNTTATTPRTAVTPRTSLNLALGLLAGLLIGLCVAVMRTVLDRSISTADELQDAAGARPLALLRSNRKVAGRPITGTDSREYIEALRLVRANLALNRDGVLPRSIVVAGCLPTNRVAEFATNLAIVAGQTGARICVVDANLRRPRLAEYVDIDGAGLADVLTGERSLREVLHPLPQPGVTAMGAGRPTEDPTVLIASSAFASLLAKLASDFDSVIVIAPPVLPLADTRSMVRQAHGTLVVVEHGKTSAAQLTEAIEAVRGVGGSVLGTVWTDVPGREARAQAIATRNNRKVSGSHTASVSAPAVGLAQILDNASESTGRKAVDSSPVEVQRPS